MLIKKLSFLSLILSVALVSGCVTAPPPKPKLNPLQIQAMQTQQFTVAKREAFDAVMTVFQNDGFVIKSASYSTGYITAKSTTRSQPFLSSDGAVHMTTGEEVAIGVGIAALVVAAVATAGHGGNVSSGGPVTTTSRQRPTHTSYSVTVTAFVTSIGKAKKPVSNIRLNFVQNRVVTGDGARTDSTRILDTKIYTKTFNEIRQQIFVAPALQQ